MNIPRIIGLAAATLTTLSFIPQVWRSLRTHDMHGISLGMYITYTIGIALWLTYGLLIGDLPVVGEHCHVVSRSHRVGTQTALRLI